jgi:hypothetical protein
MTGASSSGAGSSGAGSLTWQAAPGQRFARGANGLRVEISHLAIAGTAPQIRADRQAGVGWRKRLVRSRRLVTAAMDFALRGR